MPCLDVLGLAGLPQLLFYLSFVSSPLFLVHTWLLDILFRLDQGSRHSLHMNPSFMIIITLAFPNATVTCFL